MNDTMANFLTEREFAAYMDVSVYTVREWRAKGLISYIRIGRTIRYERTEIEAFCSRHRVARRVRSVSDEEPVAVSA